MARDPLPLAPHDRVLIIRLGAVGDVLRTLPALHLMRAAWPGMHIAWLVEELAFDLLRGHPEIDDVILCPRLDLDVMRFGQLMARLASVRRILRARAFSVAVDFQAKFKSGLLSWLSGAPRRIGFAPGSSREGSFLFANEWVRPASETLHRVQRNLAMASAMGAGGDDVTMILPEMPEEGEAAARFLRDAAPVGSPLIVLSPGTSRRQAYKRWPAGHYSRLATLLGAAHGAATLVVWGPGEESLAREIVLGSGGSARLAPRLDLRLLAAVLRRADLFIGADTGPMHLAWGVGCPVVALFGPTDPRLNAPLGDGHVILRQPAGLEAISPETVEAACREILARRRPERAPRPAPVWPRRAVASGEALRP